MAPALITHMMLSSVSSARVREEWLGELILEEDTTTFLLRPVLDAKEKAKLSEKYAMFAGDKWLFQV